MSFVMKSYRIKRAADYQESMKNLIDANVFESYAEIVMISAIIGFNEKRFVPITKNASDGIMMQYFNDVDYDIIDLIAYAHSNDQSILKKEEKYTIFETYANGGYPILLENLGYKDQPISNDDAKKYIMKYYTKLLSNGLIKGTTSAKY